MKFAVLPVLLILAGAFASPPQFAENRDVVTDLVHDAILAISRWIKESGYDPIDITRFAYEYNGNNLQFSVYLEDFHFSGGSNFIIKRLFNNVILSTFDFDLLIPELLMRIGDSGLQLGIGENKVSAELGGWLSIKDIRLVGQVRYEGNIIVGVNIVGIELQNNIGSIEADVKWIRNGNDLSEPVNRFWNDTLPNFLERYGELINAGIARVIMAIINRPF